jgi:hypothetical protein
MKTRNQNLKFSAIGLALVMSLNVAYCDLFTGLAAWWKFDEGVGTSTADASGNGNTASFYGFSGLPIWTNGIMGNALWFNGQDAHVSALDSPSINPQFLTVAGWFWPQSAAVSNSTSTLIFKSENDSIWIHNDGWVLSLGPDLRPAFAIKNSASPATNIVAQESISLSNWVHIAATYDGSNIVLYVNGAQQGYGTLPGGYTPAHQPLTIAAPNGAPGNYYKGKADDVRLYNRPLSGIEIQRLSQTVINGLVAYYPLDGDAMDVSGNTNNGTLIGPVTFVPGVHGLAAHLNGNSFIQCGSSIGNFGQFDFTIVAWVRTTTGGGLIGKRVGCGAGSFFDLRLNRPGYVNQVLFEVSGSETFAPFVTAPIDLSDGSWHQIAVERQANTLKCFVDSIESLETNTVSIDDVQNNGPLQIGVSGCTGIDGTPAFVGDIDDMRIYNRALSDVEIQQLSQVSIDGLVAYYPFNGDANDASGNGNDGATIGTANFAPGMSGLALQLDGTSFVQCGTNLCNFGQTDFTIVAWVKTTNGGGLICKRVGCTAGSFFDVRINRPQYPNEVLFEVSGNEPYAPFVAAPISLSDGNWHQIAVSRQGTRLKCFVDAVESLETNTPGIDELQNSAPLQIGISSCTGVDGTPNFVGEIDEMRIYDRALSKMEIQLLYQVPNYGLVAYFPFNGDANDASGNGNNGTLVGTVSFVPGVQGSAAHLDGASFIQCSPTLANFGHSNFTIVTWTRTTTGGGLVGKRSDCGAGSFIDVRINRPQYPNQVLFEVSGNEPYAPFVAAPISLSDGAWHQIAVERQATTLKCFVDCIEASETNTAVIDDVQNSAPLQIGISACTGVDGTPAFIGEVDETRIYNRALSPAEIQRLYYRNVLPRLELASGTGPTLTTNGLSLLLHGAIGAGYVIQASSDFNNWQAVQSFVSTNGATFFIDPAATNHSVRVYRAVTH